MTLDEIIYANSNDRIPDDMVDTIKAIAKFYALSVAREAVEEEKAGKPHPAHGAWSKDAIFALDDLLLNIESKLEAPPLHHPLLWRSRSRLRSY